MDIEKNKEILSVPLSILVGAVLISGSILYVGGGSSLGDQSAAVVQAGDSGQNVDVSVRKDAPKEGTGKIVVEEFSDFQCPFCKSFFDATYAQIKKDYIDTGKITFIYRHFPLSFHQNANQSAIAAECANVQGKFWPYHDLLFKNSKSDGAGLNIPDLKKYAADLGLDTNKFNTCLDNKQTASVVQADQSAGQSAGVTGTPTFFINGKKVVGALPLSDFKSAIDAALK